MPLSSNKLLIVSRNTLLRIEEHPSAERVFRLLANINRKGRHLLLTAPEPDHWLPTRGSVDNALLDQRRLQKRLQHAGGDLEGVYYVPRSLLTQNRNRDGALEDILQRYATSAETTTLVSSSVPFIKAAQRLGIGTHTIGEGAQSVDELVAVLEALAAE